MPPLAPPTLRLSAALAALWLSACGGGGDVGPIGSAPPTSSGPFLASSLASVAPALLWSTADATPRIWHSLSSNPTGQVLVAGEAANGLMHVSSDGGASWTTGNSTPATWIASAVSASGDRIVALQYGGGMFMSTDRGASWSRVTSSPLVFAAGGLAFEAVTMSQDGRRIAAVIQNGAIVLSQDGGATWTAGTLPEGPQNRWWRWIDGSADGSVLVAVSHNGEIYRSEDAGASWRALAVSTGGAAISETWYRVKLSADGRTIAVAANAFGGAPGTGIYVSHDGGGSWSKGFSLVANYTFLAMSADGTAIGATLSDAAGAPGRVLLSTDSGASFATLSMPGSSTRWRAITMSAGADRFAVAAGAFDTGTAGLLYTTQVAGGPAPTPAPSPAPSPAPTPAPAPTPSPAPTPAPAPTCNPPAWNGTTRYLPGNTVLRNGIQYVATPLSATVWNVNSPPEWTPTYWSVTACSVPAPTPAPSPAPSPAPTPAPSPAPAPGCTAAAWNGTTRYFPGDTVLRNGTLYVATPLSASVWNVNSPPEWTPTYWSASGCR